ncbi:hypothetical protein [Streptomyces sp. NPDC059009]|uniref:hypothetical protein n=1 Tax=Streptomyces sp. NPDC059009 TaxID=3346694 RepID=UPI003686BF2E
MLTRHSKRIALLLSAGTALSLALTGCSSDSDDGGTSGADGKPAADKAPKGVVTEAEAKKVVDNYVKVNNQANAKRDAGILSAVEGDGLFEQSKSIFKQDKIASKKDINREPFFYVKREYLIPSRSSGATWFAIHANTADAKGKSENDKGARATVIFDRSNGGPWKAVWSGWTYKSDPKVPALAKDADGFLQPVADTSKKTGVLAPDQMDDALVALYKADNKLGDKVGASQTTKWMTKFPLDQNKMLSPYGKAEYRAGKNRHDKVYALKTANGGTLTFFNAVVHEYMHGTRPDAEITPSNQMGVFLGNKKSELVFVNNYRHLAEAYIPAKGKTDMVTSDAEMISSEGPKRGF